jgi:hypothetical protein
VGVAQHLQARLLAGQQLDPGGPVRGGGGGQGALGHQPRLGLGGKVALVAVPLVGAGLAGMAGLGRPWRDPVCCDPAGDPPGAGPLARPDVLAGNQPKQRDRLSLLVVQR